jgi:hypothetical protein
MSNVDPRLAALAAPPYLLRSIETTEDREEANAAAAAAGLPFTPNMCGGACDLCGTAIWNVWNFEGSDGRRFKVGCDCAEKVFGREVAKDFERTLRREVREEKERVTREERLERERCINEANGWGRVTNDEHAEQIKAERAAAQQARRDASRHFGTVGERLVNVELRYEGHYLTEPGMFGSKMIFFLRRIDDHAAVIWKTSPQYLVRENGTDVEKGQSFVCTFTVKSHGEYKGEQQTEVSRLKIGHTKPKAVRKPKAA